MALVCGQNQPWVLPEAHSVVRKGVPYFQVAVRSSEGEVSDNQLRALDKADDLPIDPAPLGVLVHSSNVESGRLDRGLDACLVNLIRQVPSDRHDDEGVTRVGHGDSSRRE